MGKVLGDLTIALAFVIILDITFRFYFNADKELRLCPFDDTPKACRLTER